MVHVVIAIGRPNFEVAAGPAGDVGRGNPVSGVDGELAREAREAGGYAGVLEAR